MEKGEPSIKGEKGTPSLCGFTSKEKKKEWGRKMNYDVGSSYQEKGEKVDPEAACTLKSEASVAIGTQSQGRGRL